MNKLYLERISSTSEISVESVIPLFIFKYLNDESQISLRYIEKEKSSTANVPILIDTAADNESNDEDSWITTCELPNLYKSKEKIGFSGICCVCR